MDFEIGWHKLNKYTVLYNTARNAPKKKSKLFPNRMIHVN